MFDHDRLRRAYAAARADLLAALEPEGHWVGRLSSSALSTATALSALSLAAPQVADASRRAAIERLRGPALAWLAAAQNADGGWGDTDQSRSNIATTILARAALHLAGAEGQHAEGLERAADYIRAQGGLAGLRRRYGRDKTFAVPILTNAALAGLVPWDEVAPLPFEAACLPQSWYRLARLPVVSYAIPALVAIGQARYFRQPPASALLRWIRRHAVEPSLRVLEAMQPASGGYLEATPLTSFVVMSLAGTGRADHPVARRGLDFLLASVRQDGAWPIDTNLATWVTTLSINALASGGGLHAERGAAGEAHADELPGECLDWLLACQHRQRHPFTGAAPGGWGWSDLSGAVPDADDTPGALLALAAWMDAYVVSQPKRVLEAAAAGVEWLLNLQNRDGGMPTFCRGWGRLPFDRSGTDLTAHALRALQAWQSRLPASRRIARSIEAGLRFLARAQHADGSWVPLWFGNQHAADEENPVYGTSRVLLAYRDLGQLGTRTAQRGLAWLAAHQNADGGWGGGAQSPVEAHSAARSSVEETALAVEALASAAGEGSAASALQPTLEEGLNWLVEAVEQGRHRESSPIGFYFAKLWYYESLYPLIFTVSALGQAAAMPHPRPAPSPALARLDST